MMIAKRVIPMLIAITFALANPNDASAQLGGLLGGGRKAARLVIPYCEVGGHSGAYVKRLAKDGVEVKSYKGSILNWVATAMPLDTLNGEMTNRDHTYSDRYPIRDNYKQVTP